MGRFGMVQAPAASVTTVRVNPVAVCVAATVAPGSTAALSSVTRPFNSAVACAQADVVVRTTTNAETTTSRMVHIRDLHPGWRLRELCAYGFHPGGVPVDRRGTSLVPSCLVTFPSHAYGCPTRGKPSTVTRSPLWRESFVHPSRTSQAEIWSP